MFKSFLPTRLSSSESVTVLPYNNDQGMKHMPVIYLDVLITVNWVIDYLLLSTTARILRLTPKRWRLVLGGLAGSLSACLIFLTPAPTLLLLVLQLVSACILVKTAFIFTNIIAFLKQTVVLYVVSALFSGIVSFLWFLTKSETLYTKNGVVYMDISPLLVQKILKVKFPRCLKKQKKDFMFYHQVKFYKNLKPN